jgi:peroxidase
MLFKVFLKEHNRIARELTSKTNWDDERVFQEARRILGAEMQQVTYQEYLPATLGSAAMDEYSLTLNASKTTYNDKTNPIIFNEFATAAYRFGHTLVNGLILLMVGSDVVGQYNVRNNYFIPNQVATTQWVFFLDE